MNEPDNTDALLQHLKWADAEVWKKVLALNAPEKDERMTKLLYHLHQVQYAFYFLWSGFPVEIAKPESFTNLNSIAKWGFDYQKKLDEFLQSNKADEKEKLIDIPWSKFLERKTGKKVVPATLQETMFQVALHSTYHRGQINTRLRELGGEPPSVDFIVWIWLNKPNADWSYLFQP